MKCRRGREWRRWVWKGDSGSRRALTGKDAGGCVVKRDASGSVANLGSRDGSLRDGSYCQSPAGRRSSVEASRRDFGAGR
jgi:hypothetical protein